MLRVHISQAKPGMRLSLALRHPASAVILLKDGFTLDELTLQRLRDLHVNEVWVDYPGTELIRQYLSPVVIENRGQLLDSVVSMFDTLHRDAHAPLDFNHYRQTLRDMIESLVAEPVAASFLAEAGRDGGSQMQHCAEVCFLSLLLGLKLEGYLVDQRKRLRPEHARNVVTLGMGAILHDIGVTQLPPELRLPYDPHAARLNPRWQEHVTLGHKMVTGLIEPSAAGVVLQHHQHFDGSGFPQFPDPDRDFDVGMTGEEIHVFARIVCVANHFDRLRHRPDGTQLPRVAVMHEMLCTPLRLRFDPVVLAALPQIMPAFAPGSIVTLNNGQAAAVLGWHGDSPCQPTVQVVDDALDQRWGRVSEPACYDLRGRNDLWIVAQDGVDVARYNFVMAMRNQAASAATGAATPKPQQGVPRRAAG
jgi:HD-GYP domain-containing protein (c-di-GMP phosphodiesterase class II)